MSGNMVFLDSNAIIYLSKGLIELDSIIDDNEQYAASVITYMEVFGYSFKTRQEEIFIRDLLSFFQIRYLNSDIVQMVISLRKEQKIKLPDAIICATVLLEDAILMTNDIKLQDVKNLKTLQMKLK